MFTPEKVDPSHLPNPNSVRILPLFTGSPDMPNLDALDIADLVSKLSKPQTQIGFFAVEEEIRVKTVQCSVNLAADYHAPAVATIGR